MGAYKYIGELYKKKQSDVLRFLLRVRFVLWFLVIILFLMFESDAGNTVNWTSSTVLRVHLDLIRHADLDTKPSKDMLYTVSEFVAVTARSPSLKASGSNSYTSHCRFTSCYIIRCNLRKARSPGRQPTKISTWPEEYCRRAGGTKMREFASSQLILDKSRWCIQILRGHLGWSQPQSGESFWVHLILAFS